MPTASDNARRGRRTGLGDASTPVRPSDPVELRLARSAFVFVAVVAIPVVGVAALAAGAGGALGAGIGAAVVAGMFLLSGALLSWAAPLGPTALMGAAFGGYVLRLMIYAVLIVTLRPVEAIHGPSLAISAAILLVAALGWEVRLVSRNAGFFWLDTSQRPSGRNRPSPTVLYNSDAGEPSAEQRPTDDTERTRA